MGKVIREAILTIILLVGVYFAYQFYQTNNFNNFLKAESNLYTSTFKRDESVKYSDESSYKITSNEFNDAMFYQTLKTEKNTPYRVTCMVKTNNVISENDISGSGAQIAIEATTERSIAVTGTTDWQQIELIFNSKDRQEVNIGFRLGGYLDNAKGEAWFSDFKVEVGYSDETNTNWNFACFIFDEVSANVNGKEFNYKLTQENISDMTDTIKRFQASCVTLSNGKMTANCDTYEINSPITKLSYDDEYGYYVAPEDIEDQIKSTIDSNDYDHIFIIFKLDDEEVKDWIGLGSMDYYGVGFSNIRLPIEANSYIYKYDARINLFPEEVLLHEFLHSLERTLKEYNYEVPALHDYETYGYANEKLIGQKKWYTDYMNCTIETDDGLVGLNSIVYTLKPAKKSNFVSAYTMENPFDLPKNILQEITQILTQIKTNVTAVLETVE